MCNFDNFACIIADLQSSFMMGSVVVVLAVVVTAVFTSILK